MSKIIVFDVQEYCEHDGCFDKPEKIFIYENYPLQLCRGCFEDFANVLRRPTKRALDKSQSSPLKAKLRVALASNANRSTARRKYGFLQSKIAPNKITVSPVKVYVLAAC